MKRRLGLSRELLRESDDALRSILGLLDDVGPATLEGFATPLDIHLALGALDELYAGAAHDVGASPEGFRSAARTATRLGPHERLGA